MSLFLLLVNFIAALVAVQLLRGDVPGSGSTSGSINFGGIFNAFLGVYQVFSSENWTNVLYGTVQAEIPLSQAVILAIFFSAWLLFANCKSMSPASRTKLMSSSHRVANVRRRHQRELQRCRGVEKGSTSYPLLGNSEA